MPARLPLVLTAGLIGGCAMGLDRPQPPAINQAAAFSATLPSVEGIQVGPNEPWWRHAVATEICTTLEAALAANPELRRAQAEVAAARAQSRQAEAATGPSLSLAATARVESEQGDARNSRSVAADGELPLDISGALRQRVNAARLAARSAAAEAVRLESDLAADFLLALLDGAEAGERHALLLRQIEVAETLLRLIELRFTQGLASSVDVLQQRDELATLRQQLPLTRLDRQTAANQLRRVAALTPDQGVQPTVLALSGVSAAYPAVAPVDLLQRRASLRASRARLEAADARFAAALADRLPTLRLSSRVLARAAAGDVSTLISAAVDAALTVFDSGAKLSIAAERRAQLAAAGEQYLADWIAAVIEVDDLILEEGSLRERITLSEQRLETAQALLSAAQRRYERGVSDYLPVLAALRGLQQQQRDQLALQADLARTGIRLHRALGHSPGLEDA